MNIIPASKLKTKHSKEEIITIMCEVQMGRIKDQIKMDSHRAPFDPYVWENEVTGEIASNPKKEWRERGEKFNSKRYAYYNDEVKNRFINAGYRIAPTGYIGGVWQTTESIYW